MRSASRKLKSGNKAQAPIKKGQEMAPQALFSLTEVFDAIPEGISVHSADGVTLYANAKIGEICNKPLNEIVGSSCADLFHVEAHDCPHQEVVEGGQRSELKGRHTVGERIYSIAFEPIINGSGSVSGYVRVMRDVTDRRRAQEGLLNTERFATLGQMIFGIAHDVGTPLNIISGYCEYLLMRAKPEDLGHRELSTILHQTRRIADYIKQMLDLARPAQGRADAIVLKGFLTESLDLIGHLLRRENVKASLVFEEEPPLIYSDAPRLRQALFNIFLNVSQQLGQGAILEITVDEPASDGGMTRVSIAGIDSGGNGLDFSLAFAGFLDPAQSGEAIGMGLSLARHILDELGAKVDTAEMPGKGTALVVSIPKDSRAHAQKAF